MTNFIKKIEFNPEGESLITLDYEHYKKIDKDSLRLEALRQAGVDNWEWYGEHFATYNELLKKSGYESEE